MGKKTITVLIVDDHAGMREGISAIINAQPDMEVIGEAVDGYQAVEKFRVLRPNVTLVDVNLAAISGIEVIALIREEVPRAQFIVITALTDDDCIRRAFRAGAKAFLHKDMLRRELLPAIRVVHSGQQYIPDAIGARLKPK